MQRKQYSTEFKTKAAIEALKGLKTVNELASELGVHPSQIALWKKQALDVLPEAFSTHRGPAPKKQEDLTAQLYQQIGQLKVELDWVKKKLDWPVAVKRSQIEPGHLQISIERQCELIGLARSSWYYEAVQETPYNEHLQRTSDALNRPTIYRNAVLRNSSDDSLVAHARRSGEP
jgi:putative transposase